MKNLLAVMFSLLLFINPLFAQTITSTSNGGNWSESSTWIGGVVPGINNDVIINGHVLLDGNRYVRNLTVNQGAVVENSSGYPDLSVEANLTNSGTIRNGSSGYMDLYVKGNLTNNGTMSQSFLTFNGGTGNQTINAGASIGIGEIGVSPNSTIKAGSNLNFNENVYFNFGGDTLDMGTFKFTNYAPEKGFAWGFIKTNGEVDIDGRFRGHCIGNVTFSGNNALKIDGNLWIEGNLTVNQNKVVENRAGYPDFYIQGNLVNYGTIRNSPDMGGYLDLYCTENITNHGTFSNSFLTFNGGTNTQKIGGSSTFSISEIGISPNGIIWASSDIKFDEAVYLNFGGDTLNMGNYKLTCKSTDRGLAWGYINSTGELDISGLFRMNLMGDYKLVGNEPMQIGNNLYFKGEVEISSNKVIENYGGYPDVYIQGNLVNYGTIRNSPDMGGYLDAYSTGNITNHGTFSNSFLTFNGGTNTQKIGGPSTYSISEIGMSPNGVIWASSDISFDEAVYLNFGGDTLNMGAYKLVNNASDRGFAWGYVKSEGELDVSGLFRGNLLGDLTFVGDSALKVGANLYFNADVTIAEGKTVENYSGYPDIYFYGNLVNYGTIRNNPVTGGYLDVYCYGDMLNYNEATNSYITQIVRNTNISCMGEFTTEYAFTFEGDGPYGQIEINDYFRNYGYTRTNETAKIYIPPGAEFSLIGSHGGPYAGSFINDGSLYNWYNTPYNQTLTLESQLFIGVQLVDKGSLGKVHITANNNQAYPALSSSVKRWWTLEGEGEVESYILTLRYEDDLLNGQNENNLKVFVTSDNGENWNLVSTPANTSIDAANNIITVGTNDIPVTAALGDFIISSNEIVELPSISLSIGGRRQIRVGPPNRYTITYWNNKNFLTDYAFLELTSTMGVHIMGIETTDIVTGEKVEVPIDSLTYDGVNDQVYLLVQPMQPKEVRTFDVILGAFPGLGKTTGVITFGGVVLWTTLAAAEEYVSNTVVEGCYEMWRPVKHDESLMEAGGKVIGNSIRKAVTVENGVKGIAKKGAESLLKKFGRVVAWPAFLAKDVFDCMGNTVRGMKDYVNGNFDKADKGLEKVTSCDPNAKEGPQGFGMNGYMATSAPMTYTIFFENKKEATAPAWKIVILDTLDEDVFDVSTVVPGAMSHNMGEFTQEGNILKWEFVEIELPPNANPPEGEGWVRFTIHPKENLPTGTVIENHAVITFDLNDPISTNSFINTLDYEPPVSTPLALKQIGNKIEFTWSAADGTGSGIKKSMVFVSSGGGPYDLAGVCDSSKMYVDITPEREYKFYVLSEDNVGNSESEPSQVLDIVTGMEEEEIIPEKYELFQNYPNPFNPATKIKYWIPAEGFVELKIYNILGQEVLTLVNEFQKAGSYEKVLNLKNFASGIYIYSIKVNSFTSYKKLMLLK